jgi:RimJ/RimL family protein N-acetyltransferase
MSTPVYLRKDISIVPLTIDHASNMYHWMLDPSVSVNIGLRSSPSLEKTIDWLQQAIDSESINGFAIMREYQHIGNVIIDRIDSFLSTARLSIYIGDISTRGKNAGATAAYRALRYAFAEKMLHKIWLTVHTYNTSAINTYTRLGFSVEGILRDEFWLNDKRTNVIYMGLLRNEFNSLAVEWID